MIGTYAGVTNYYLEYVNFLDCLQEYLYFGFKAFCLIAFVYIIFKLAVCYLENM